MSDIKTIFAEKKFPQFITTHSIFRTFKEVRKIFPEIGLPNVEKEIEVDNKQEVQQSADFLMNAFVYAIDRRLQGLQKYSVKKVSKGSEKPPVGTKRIKKLENAANLLTAVRNNLANQKNKFLTSNNGRITLNLPNDILDSEKKVAFKNGEGLFRVYNKLNEVLRDGHFLAMAKFEDFPEFKDFSSKNVPALKYKVRFSSDGSDGAWDIATMSMRGITSCQTWNPSQTVGTFTHIVGSMADPFTGIIYLTSGANFNEYGSKMIRRCVVRFMVNEKTKAPFIALEKMYPYIDRPSVDAFIAFLKEKTDNKFAVHYLPDAIIHGYVPMSKIVNSLGVSDQPYRDSQIPYKLDVNNSQERLRQTLEPRLEAIYAAFASKIIAALRAIKMGAIPNDSKQAFKALRGTDYSYDVSYSVYQDMVSSIRGFFNMHKISNYEDADLYINDGLIGFSIKLEDRILSAISKSAKERLHYSRNNISKEVLALIAKMAALKVDAFIASEIKKLKIDGKKPVKKSPAPIYANLLDF